MSFLSSEVLKEAFTLVDKSEIDLETIKDLLSRLYTTAGHFQFSFQLNDILKKVIQCRRTETARYMVQALCDLSYQMNFDPVQINWTECFKFLSQLSNLEFCLEPVLRMLDKKIYLPEVSMNFLVENLIETRHYEQSLKVLIRLKDHARIGKLNIRSILKNFILFDQHEHAFHFLELLPLESTSTMYVWEDYIQSCCQKDKIKEARESIRNFFLKTLPDHKNEAENIYSTFLSNLIKGESVRETICGTIDDIIQLKIKVKPNVLKDALLKLLDEKIHQKEFFIKVELVKHNLESREFTALLSRLIQLGRKIEVMALLDMIVNESSFSFKLSDLNLSAQDMKYILMAQSYSIRYLLDETDRSRRGDDSRSVISVQSDSTSIIDRLTFNEEDVDGSFEKLSTTGI